MCVLPKGCLFLEIPKEKRKLNCVSRCVTNKSQVLLSMFEILIPTKPVKLVMQSNFKMNIMYFAIVKLLVVG